MTEEQRRRLRAVKTFAQLIDFLRDELDWPIDQGHDEDDLTFDWSDDLGLKDDERVAIKQIKQLRPLETGQPWGIFFVDFERKNLPIVILRRILNALVLKKRASANRAQQAAWQQRDLLFISAYGQENERQLTFAHFSEPSSEFDATKATLRVLGWDDDDTSLKLDYVADMLKAKLTWPKDTTDLKSWRLRWGEAFELRHREVIDTAQDLALRLADLAKRIRNRMLLVLPRESESGDLRKLLKGFQAALIHDLDEAQFADMYAQTITYGLFSAAVSRTVPGAGTAVHQGNVVDMVPVTNPFLREMLQSFLKAGGRRGKLDFDELGIQEVVDLLNDPKTHMDAVLRDFGNRTRGEDPVIHFYEEFLKAYDKKLKVQRGVFYTPQPVVSFIVRSVHELLQTEFGLVDGLADTATWGEMLKRHPGLKLPPLTDEPGDTRTISPDEPFVLILDPATGTATFLVEVIEVIFRTLKAKWREQRLSEAQQATAWNEYVPKHLLPRLHAYELMMAPYAIAHMKIGLKLAETGYRFGTEERARIYLTNALEPWARQLPLIGFDALAHEAAAVNEIKRHKRFTVVVGNPPYSNFGQLNKNPFILGLLEDYKRGLDERKINLDDDFIKFLRLSQYSLEKTGCGVLGMITNNAYLDGITHRQMRRSLITQFGSATVVDLHGNARKAEFDAGGNADQNVFDIMQGVAVCIFASGPITSAPSVRVAHVQGTREEKYAVLGGRQSSSLNFVRCVPHTPYYLFQERSDILEEYTTGIPISEVFQSYQSPIQTKRDGLTIHFTKHELQAVLDDLSNLPDDKIREKYDLAPDGRDWTLPDARSDVRSGKGTVVKLGYKPFDFRFSYYTGKSRGFVAYPRDAIMRHMFRKGARAFVFKRQAREDKVGYTYFFTTDCPFSEGLFAIDPRGREFIAPLRLVPDERGDGQLDISGRTETPNLTPEFLRRLASSLHLSQSKPHGLPASLTPEDIFHYAYAVFHSPGYRSRYADLLKIDFPRLPLTGNLELFRARARMGGELTALHLLESPKLAQPVTEFIGSRDLEVEKLSWLRDTVWVNKAQTTGFQGVREEVWNFHIGGYQVCEKWLKDRKGRTLSEDDITHYQKIVVALSETIRLMAEIDRVIDEHGGWPAAFQTTASA